MEKNLYYSCVKSGENVSEGGKVRDNAIKNWLRNQCDNFVFEEMGTSKVEKILNIFKYFKLLRTKNSLLFLQYPCTGVPMLGENIIQKILKSIYLSIIKRASKKNKVIYDIADLPYEQSKDLELKKLSQKNIEQIEKTIFNLPNTELVFASKSMMDYAKKKYKIKSNCKYCPNGGNDIDNIENYHSIKEKFKKNIALEKINYIYAGTLNKGRQIENIIKRFPKSDKYNLILIGQGGEWLSDISKENSSINYLGALEEKEAAILTSMCDIGLIPYDSSRMYYNIAYPTKLSFYISAGITFLATNVSEVNRIKKTYQVGYVADIEKWGQTIQNTTKLQIVDQNNKIKEYKSDFYWSNILNKINL